MKITEKSLKTHHLFWKVPHHFIFFPKKYFHSLVNKICSFMSLCIFLSRTVCAEGQRADGPGKRTPVIPWLAAFTVSLSSWSGSSTERKAAYTPPKSNFPIMPILNASWEGFQVLAIPLGSFYCASCHHPMLVSPGSIKLGLCGW